jgi:pyridoxine 5-phosphate synthase
MRIITNRAVNDMAKLCVNIDHVATIRQARLDVVPDPVEAAKIVEKAGAAGITVHLREDRRHINDNDVIRLKKAVKKKLNLEMSITPDIVKRALEVVPDEATIVPENRRELTTEGGLDVAGNLSKIKNVVSALKNKGVQVSLFIEADPEQIRASKAAGADFIEIHTGKYANAKTKKEENIELNKIKAGSKLASSLGLKVNAGHGLTYKNAGKIAAIKEVVDLNIGHNIIARAVITGMEKAVKEMLKAVKGK